MATAAPTPAADAIKPADLGAGMRVTVEARVFATIIDISATPDPEQVVDDTSLEDDLAFDSFDFVELGFELEGQFDGIFIPDDALEACSTVRDVIDLVHLIVAAEAARTGGASS